MSISSRIDYSLPNLSMVNMWETANNHHSTQELVDAYAATSNKFWWVEDCIYDYEEGTNEYIAAHTATDAWRQLMDCLEKQVIECAIKEGLFAERQEKSGLVRQLERFMKKHGYRDGNGWWIRI